MGLFNNIALVGKFVPSPHTPVKEYEDACMHFPFQFCAVHQGRAGAACSVVPQEEVMMRQAPQLLPYFSSFWRTFCKIRKLQRKKKHCCKWKLSQLWASLHEPTHADSAPRGSTEHLLSYSLRRNSWHLPGRLGKTPLLKPCRGAASQYRQYWTRWTKGLAQQKAASYVYNTWTFLQSPWEQKTGCGVFFFNVNFELLWVPCFGIDSTTAWLWSVRLSHCL